MYTPSLHSSPLPPFNKGECKGVKLHLRLCNSSNITPSTYRRTTRMIENKALPKKQKGATMKNMELPVAAVT